jgi:hypothetical protein
MRTSLHTALAGNDVDVPPSQRQFEKDSLDLAKQLQCPICLETFGLPVARLRPCMHYFCASCIREALHHSATNTDKCPQCKHAYTRRDIEEDGFLSGLIGKFMAFEEVRSRVRDSMKDLERVIGVDRGGAGDGDGCDGEDMLARQKVENLMLPWVQGVEDAAYESPEESFSELFTKRREKGGELMDDGATHAPGAGEGGAVEVEAAANGVQGGVNDDDRPEDGAMEEMVGPTQLNMVPPSESDSEGAVDVFVARQEAVESAVTAQIGDILQRLDDEDMVEAAAAARCVTGERARDCHVAREERNKKRNKGKKDEMLVVPSVDKEALELTSSPGKDKENAAGNERQAQDGAPTAKRRGKVGAVKAVKAVVAPAAKKTTATKNTKSTKNKKAICMTGNSAKATKQGKEVPQSAPALTPMTAGTPLRDSRRRVPARLMPWTCGACTFENKGAAADCEICGAAKGKDAGQVVAEQASIAKEAKKDTKDTMNTKNMKNKKDAGNLDALGSAKAKNKRKNAKQMGGLEDDTAAGVSVEATPVEKTKMSARERRLLSSMDKKEKKKSKTSKEAEAIDKIAGAKGKAPIVCGGTKGASGTFLSGVVACASNLSAEDKRLLNAECIPKYVSSWSDSVTHVICPSSKEPVVTFKYLLALLKGAHIVSIDWLIQCIEQEAHLDEAPFNLKPDSWTGTAAGPKQSALLSKYEVQVVVPPVSKKENPVGMTKMMSRVEGLLKDAGAKVVNRLPRASSDRHCLVLVVDGSSRNADDPNETSQIVMESWFARAQGAQIPVVRQAWLKESILNGAALDNYLDYSI